MYRETRILITPGPRGGRCPGPGQEGPAFAEGKGKGKAAGRGGRELEAIGGLVGSAMGSKELSQRAHLLS
jgi:hypothetical protein